MSISFERFCICIVWTILISMYLTSPSCSHDADYDPIQNLSCFTYDYEEYILCSWNIQQGYSNTININVFKLSKYLDDKPVSIGCSERSETYCKMDMVDLDIDPTNHHLNICIVFQCFNVDYTFLVKPSPVENIVSRSNSTCIDIAWSHSKSDESLYPVQTYRIRLLSQWNTDNGTVINSTSTKVVICGLIPNTYFAFYVSVKPKGSGVWSDERNGTVYTLSDVPFEPPQTCRTCISIINSKIQLYWKKLSKWQWNDNTLEYCILIINNTQVEQKLTKCEYFTNKSTSIIRLRTLDSRLLGIRSSNSKGISSTYSKVLIPLENKLLKAPQSLGELDMHKRLLNITWLKSAFDATYVIFWCYIGRDEDCKGDVHWNNSPPGVPWMVINVTDLNYKFAVAVETPEAVSGIHWNKCIIAKSGMINFSPEVAVNSTSQSLCISWHYPGCSYDMLRRHISHHIVNFCRNANCKGDDMRSIVVHSNKTTCNMDLPTDAESICITVVPYFRGNNNKRSDMKCINVHAKESTQRAVIILIVITITVVFTMFICLMIHRCYRSLYKGLEVQIPDVRSGVSIWLYSSSLPCLALYLVKERRGSPTKPTCSVRCQRDEQ